MTNINNLSILLKGQRKMTKQIEDEVFREAAKKAAKNVFIPKRIKEIYKFSVKSHEVHIEKKKAT